VPSPSGGRSAVSTVATIKPASKARVGAGSILLSARTTYGAGQILAYFAGDHATGLGLIDRALTLNDNSALAWCARGYVLIFANQGEPAIESFSNAMRLNPFDPLRFMLKTGMAGAHMIARRFEGAMTWIDKSLQAHPGNPVALRWKTSLCGHLGKTEEGQRCVQDLLSLYPGVTIKGYERRSPLAITSPGMLSILLDGSRKAGLPEQ